jgi:hypothetical protein
MAIDPPYGWAPSVLLLLGGALLATGAVGLMVAGRGWANLVIVLGGLTSVAGSILLHRRTRSASS